MTHSTKLNRDHITSLIKQAETIHGHKLCIEDFDFLTATIEDFTNKAITKFILGSKEHNDDGGDFVSSVAHAAELENEVIDLLMYLKGLRKKYKI